LEEKYKTCLARSLQGGFKQKGKMAKSDAYNLWERLKENEKAVLLFAKERSAPFTNNRA